MADTLSITYDFVLPEIGGSDDTWGTKLNADFVKLDALLTDAFTGGTPTDLGILKEEHLPAAIDFGSVSLSSASPHIDFFETDQVMPAGRYRFIGNVDTLKLQRNTHATTAFTTVEDIFSARGATKSVDFGNYSLVVGAALAAGQEANITAYGVGNHYRIKNANDATGIGTIIRTDTGSFYILLTNNNDADGAYNALRPFYVNKTTGRVSMNEGLTVTGSLTANNGLALFEGLNLADDFAASATDLSKHIDLYGTNHGFNVTSGVLHYVVPAASIHYFYNGGVAAARVDDAGTTIPSVNTIITREKGDSRYVQPADVGAGLAYNAIGSTAMLKLTSGTCAPNATKPGTSLVYTDAEGTAGSTNPPGTWRCQGEISGTGNGERTTLWIRVS